MWSNAKSKSKTNKALTSVSRAISYYTAAQNSRKTSKQRVAKITRDGYGDATSWYSLCAEIRKRDGHKCVKCDTPEDRTLGVYHDVHHVRPLSKGGTTTKANLILLCKNCHEGKHKHMRRK